MYILALDQGTTSSRAILFNREGKILSVAQKEYPQIYPQAGWVEHDPSDIWSTQIGVAGEALARANISPREVTAIGITNQRETTIIWERATGKPIHNAIVWQCRRTAPRCEQLRAEGFAALVRAKTGLVLDAYFSGTKVEWLLDNVPGARERAANGELAFGTVDTWLLWNLSGGRIHATDVSNASRTMLYNIHTGDWDDELLARLNIPRALLPKVLPSSALYGETDANIFGAAVPIGGVAGDQQAATFGQACYQVGSVKNTYGTGCFMLMNTGQRAVESQGGLLTTIAWQLGDQPTIYALEGSVFVAGAAIQWLRDELQLIRTAAESEAVAASVPDSNGVYVVPAFVGLGAPYWDSFARGTIVGLTRGSNRAHIVRATLESIAFQTRDVVEVMIRDAGLQLETLRVDGGAVANNWLMQFQADILGVPVVRPAVTETTALGAAYLAGLAVGYWQSPEQIAAQWAAEKTFVPRMSAEERERRYHGWQRAVERAKAWLSA
ncbi:MAG: glycerol kinase [Candidatus Thermofonsia Clade 1 bacterium]|uniref:Glycerol kinase n=1 Tax=Candidatus Thermofonsia Clade 1 bacterium TaxID=2364210 RepID=A0A2M8PEU3_9CHLR|nr:MAG: glycerol kinase [Candidatus Thermofonsia Clade 1 bacterium]RMF48778.1 MAG: glycerol kinase [Chloroflexota bacterium]